MAGRIYIGIAGWSYPDWKQIVFTTSKIDQLRFVSQFVDCIEIKAFSEHLTVFYKSAESL